MKEVNLLELSLKAIANRFDYDKISSYYKKHNWLWVNEDIKISPSSYDIRKEVLRMINVIIKENLAEISCGGITVHADTLRLYILFSKYKTDGIKFGEYHNELSSIDTVSDYFESFETK